MTYLMANEIKVEADEAGWELHIHTDEEGLIVVNIHGVAWDFANDVRQIQAWRAEGESARAYHPVMPDDLDAYEPGDPKRIALQREIDERRS